MSKIIVKSGDTPVDLTADGLPYIGPNSTVELTKYKTYNQVTSASSYTSAISARTLIAYDEFGGMIYSNAQGGVPGSLVISGTQDASSNPNYPSATVGQALRITVAGKIGGSSGKVVEVGDLVICVADNAGGTEGSVGTSWIVMQGNTLDASETLKGIIELATQAEVNTGTDAVRAVTPATLKANLVSRTPVTVKKTIGFPGDTGKDFTWTTAANQTAQNLDLGAIIPAKARIIDAIIVCDQTVAGGATLDLAAGNASAGTQIFASANCDAANDIVGVAAGGSPVVAVNISASNVWVKGTIGSANWSTMTGGRWSVYVTYIDNAKLD